LELTVRLVAAASEHLPAVRALLLRAALPPEGLEAQFPGGFVIAQRQNEIAGAAGLERHGDVGLLRSVVVAEQCRGLGVGRRLVEDRLKAAVTAGLARVFLLTTTARTYFETLGFVLTARAEVPAALSASTEFASACPASASCLVYDLDPAMTRVPAVLSCVLLRRSPS
jgi:amino-acid N-acetyltransferase